MIHACVPETSGPLLPGGWPRRPRWTRIVFADCADREDFAIAEGINAQKVIGLDRGMQRWTTMFERKHATGADRFAVRIDGRPGR